MISIAIATMRRWSFLAETLPTYLDCPSIKEVVVCDETGEDFDAIRASSLGNHSKLRLYKNDHRLGIYQNKLKAAAMTTGEWIAVLDSDNVFSQDWFATVEEAIIKDKNPNMMYACADFMFVNTTEKTSSKPCEQYSGLVLSKQNWNQYLRQPGMNCLVNDGNFVIPRAALACLPFELPSSATWAADAIYMLKRFLEGGFSITYIKELGYLHIVHPGSTWIQTEKQSMEVFNTTDWTIKN